MQWESSSTLPTVGEDTLRFGNLIPSGTTEEKNHSTMFQQETLNRRRRGSYRRMGCCWGGMEELKWNQVGCGGCCSGEESRTLGNDEGFPVQSEPRDLVEQKKKKKRTIKQESHSEPVSDSLRLHFPCFLFSSISIRLSLRFSSLAFFCLRRLLFSKSSEKFDGQLEHEKSRWEES